MSRRDPVFEPIAVADLRPTQITVGYREVAEKRRLWSERPKDDRRAYLARHMIPVVLGPRRRPYIIDHHHLARALLDEGVSEIGVNVTADLSRLGMGEFWIFCDHFRWCHPYDAGGVRQSFEQIPHALADLQDDPFRSLAGELRRAGGYAKETTPFSEFTWADFLRRRIKRKLVEQDFAAALIKALKLAKSRDADHLPGWCGPWAPG